MPESPEEAAATRAPSVEAAVFARRASLRGVHRAGAAVSAPSRPTPPARLSPPPPSPSPSKSSSPAGFQAPRPERPRAPSADVVVDDEDDFEGYDDLLDDDDDDEGGRPSARVDSRAVGRRGGGDVGSPRRGLGGPMSRLPRAPSPPPLAAWRARLPTYVAASELVKGEYHLGEKVYVSYGDQFETGGGGGGGGGAGARGRGGGDREGRWFREDGMNKFVDARGEVLTGRAAWRASEKAKAPARRR